VNEGSSSNTYWDVSRGGESSTNANLVFKVYQDGVLKQTTTVVGQFSNSASSATTISNTATAPTSAIEWLYAPDSGISLKFVDGLTGTDSDEMFVGTAGANTLTGNGGTDLIFGGAGADTLNGGAGVDVLIGGAGNDTLIGGLGNDTLTGGDGNDVFIFNTAIANNVDTILDFVAGTDKIQLSKSVFTSLGTTGSLTNNAFWSAAGAVAGHDADDRVVYNTTTGALYYDADGTGSVAAVQIAILGSSSHPTLTNADFAVIA
jgi:hypothetical protein